MFDKVFIIAEVGSNHNGNLDTAIEIVHRAGESGADAVKFQDFTLLSLFSPKDYEQTLRLEDRSWRRSVELLSVKHEWHGPLAYAAHEAGIHYFSTPFSPEAADSLSDLVPFYKIASGDITYVSLLERVASKGKGIFLSTGASRIDEIERAVGILNEHDLPFVCIMHCIMLYPPPDETLHLNFIDTLKKRFNQPIGFSDHSLDTEAALIAVAKGACAVEKHFTLDRTQKGPDHKNSLDPEGFRGFTQRIRRCERMLGDLTRPIGEREGRERVYARRGIYAGEDLKKGEKLTPEKVRFLRPRLGAGAEDLGSLKNRRLDTDVTKGTSLDQSMFT
jgi:sialic acid synthase SpsE